MTTAEQQAIEVLKALSPESQLFVMASVGKEMTGFAPGYRDIVKRRTEEMESGTAKTKGHAEVMRLLDEQIANA
jgi:hypothetical protein